MILKNRLFIRTLPSREAKSLYIFCEGVKRERQYFEYFKEIDSRINIEVYHLDPEENNSPIGLYQIAYECLVKSNENPIPKFELLEEDEVWIVIDTDVDKTNSREEQISTLRDRCNLSNWYIAQSNPCFEVWLYNHFFETVPKLIEIEKCNSWKRHLDNSIGSGFDSRKHPILIRTAMKNSRNAYSETGSVPDVGKTQLFNLAKSIYSLVHEQIEEALKGEKMGKFIKQAR